MFYIIGYILFCLLIGQRVFITFLRNEKETWGFIDDDDIFPAALLALVGMALAPFVLIGYIIYSAILKPTMEAIEREGK